MRIPRITLTILCALLLASSAMARQPRAVRTRYLEAKPGTLRAASSPGDLLPLRLFSDASYMAVLESLEEDPFNGLVWRGYLSEHPDSWVIMVEREGVMAGVLTTGDRVFRVRYAGGGRHAIEEIAPRSLRSTRDDTIVPDLLPTSEDLAISSASTQSNGSGVAEIDVLMVYTGKAAKRLIKKRDEYFWIEETSARKAIESQARLSIAVANAALDNSQIPARFRLVAVKKIGGKGSGDFGKDLDRLRHPSDGYMDRVHALRRQYGADFVVLILGKTPKNIAGVGYVVPSTYPYARNYAFSVVRCTSLWWTTVAHEIGHNMGLVHDPRNDQAPPEARSHPYSRGYQNRAKGLATMMSYTKGCSSCWLRIPHYSNPKVKWRGDSQPSHPDLLQPACRGNEPSQYPDISFPACGTPTGKKRFNSAKSISKDRWIFAGYQACQVDCQ